MNDETKGCAAASSAKKVGMREGPQQFEKVGKAYIGHAVAIKSQCGAEIIILCPTKDEAIVAAESWGQVDINPRLIKRAALGPVSQFAANDRDGRRYRALVDAAHAYITGKPMTRQQIAVQSAIKHLGDQKDPERLGMAIDAALVVAGDSNA